MKKVVIHTIAYPFVPGIYDVHQYITRRIITKWDGLTEYTQARGVWQEPLASIQEPVHVYVCYVDVKKDDLEWWTMLCKDIKEYGKQTEVHHLKTEGWLQKI